MAPRAPGRGFGFREVADPSGTCFSGPAPLGNRSVLSGIGEQLGGGASTALRQYVQSPPRVVEPRNRAQSSRASEGKASTRASTSPTTSGSQAPRSCSMSQAS